MPLWIRYDGLVAGGQRGSDVIINEAPPVSTDVRFDRTDRLGADGQMAGRDLISKRVWDFTLFTNQSSEDEAVALAQAWERAWHDPEVRSGVKKVPLEYSRDNQTWYRVYGRPTLFTGPELNVLTRQGAGQIDLQFEQLDPWHYSEHDEEVTLGVSVAPSGGFVVPLELPVEFATSGGALSRTATNAGQAGAPVTLRFDGPVSNPEVTLQGYWTFRVNGSLAWDEYLVIDPQDTTATIYSTTSNRTRAAYSMISTGSRFGDLVIPPGQHMFTFTAVDPTFTASMTASWPHTFRTMQ